jgi:predicted membrane-bound mannosyltransferase|tara:strand:+ start:396 stop:821 length:426 start_codon:yes stop_codon:yes gene_type:complete
MATTTATVNISSTDLQPGNALGISASTTLYQTGTTTGLELVDYGVGKLTQASAGDALAEALGTADTSNYVYICNTSTDKDQYMVIGIHDTVVGNLGSEEWLFMPWNMGDSDAEINIEAETSGSITYEYAIFKSTYTLPAKT